MTGIAPEGGDLLLAGVGSFNERGQELTSALGEAHMELRLWRKKGALYPATRNSKRNADPLG